MDCEISPVAESSSPGSSVLLGSLQWRQSCRHPRRSASGSSLLYSQAFDVLEEKSLLASDVFRFLYHPRINLRRWRPLMLRGIQIDGSRYACTTLRESAHW